MGRLYVIRRQGEIGMSGMPHNEAKEYLDSYLARKSDQGMAVLIDGHWGAGKTHFVKTYFKDRKIRLSKNRGKKQRPDYLYASFFGAPDEAAVADQFLSQLYPSLNSKLGKVLGTAAFRIGSTLFEAASKVNSPVEPGDVDALRAWAAQPMNRIVVFDDLERSGLGVERSLALINGYVERDGIRVIVIANASEIDSVKYSAWKEKVIGKSLFICADADEVVESIARELPSGSVKNYLVNKGGKIAEVARASNYPNYRSVKNLIADVHRIVSNLPESLAANPVVIESLVLFSAGIGAEFRAGKLTAEEIINQSQIYFGGVKSPNELRLKQVREIYAKYQGFGAAESHVPTKCMIALWETGELQHREISEALMSDPRVVGEAATPAWRRLWSMWDLGRVSYESARREALELLERGAVTIEGELLHIVGAALQVEDYGAEFFPNQRALDWLRLYLERAEVRSNLIGTSIYWRVGSNTAHAGLGYTGQDLPAFAEARQLVTAALLEMEEERNSERLNDYLGRLRSGEYEIINVSGAWDGATPYGAWLHLIEPSVFVSILINDCRVVRELNSRLQARYSSDHEGKFRREWVWLIHVRKLGENLVAEMVQPHRAMSEGYLKVAQTNIRDALRQAWRRRHIEGRR